MDSTATRRRQRATETLRVLLIEDNPCDARMFDEHLREWESRVDLQWEQELTAGLAALKESPPDVTVLDLGLPDSEGTETVRRCVDATSTPVVVLTAEKNLDTALSALQAGATEYLQKGELTPTLLERTLRWAIERTRMEAELSRRDAWIRPIAVCYRLRRTSSRSFTGCELGGRSSGLVSRQLSAGRKARRHSAGGTREGA